MADEKQQLRDQVSALLAEGNPDNALAVVKRLLSLDPEDPASRSLSGDVHAWLGQVQEAYKAYTFAAEAYNRAGDFDRMLDVQHKTIDLDLSRLDQASQNRIRLLVALVEAEDHVKAGRPEPAIAAYQKAIHAFPNHTVSYQRLATLFVRLGRKKDAVSQYLIVARAFFAHQVQAKAKPYFLKVLELDPRHEEALRAVRRINEQDGKLDAMVTALRRGCEAMLIQGEIDSVFGIVKTTPELQGSKSAYLIEFGRLLKGEKVPALPLLEAFEPAGGEQRETLTAVGAALEGAGRLEDAKAFYRKAVALREGPNAGPLLQALENRQEHPAPAPAPAAVLPPVPAPPAPPAAMPPPVAAPPAPPATALPTVGPAVGTVAPQGVPVPPPPPPPPRPAVPPPGLGTPAPPPPGLGLPAAPPATALPTVGPAVGTVAPQGMPVPPPPLPEVRQAPSLSSLVADSPQPQKAQAPAPAPAGEDDKNVLFTMGEMCLAEEMFDEARQVYQKLVVLEPENKLYVKQLNLARDGLGLDPLPVPGEKFAPAPVREPPAPPPPLPPIPVAPPTPSLPPMPAPPPPMPAPPATALPTVGPAVGTVAPQGVPVPPPPAPPMPASPPPPVEAFHLPPSARPLGSRPAVAAHAIPDMPDLEEGAGKEELKTMVGRALEAMEAKILRTAHRKFVDMELPPVMPSGDYDDDLIG